MISFVIPVFNEEESLEAFYKELSTIAAQQNKDFEIIFVDDGSTDKSLTMLKDLAKKEKNIEVFSFRRNLGKAEALTFGFIKAKGDFIVTLDADLQDKPTEIPKLLEKQKEGFDLVSGWRKNRRDKSRMVVISKFFNFIVGKMFNTGIHDYNCGLKLYTSEAAKSLHLYGGMHRFIPFLLFQQGFTIAEVEVEHQPRKFGKSKFGFSKLWRDLPDIFTMLFLAKYSKRPLHFFGIIGSIFSLIGIIILLYLTALHFEGHSIARRPILFLGMLFIIAGFQVFFTGFLADLMINIAHEPRMLDEKQMHFRLRYSSEKK